LKPFYINPDITQAETLPSSFYRSEEIFNLLIEKVFAKTWQYAGDTTQVSLSQQIHPFYFLEFALEEPMLLTNSDGKLSCISNVCTHRGNILCHSPMKSRQITCSYHGRRFNLQGDFQHMPQFKEALDFPRKSDNLTNFPFLQWGPWLFTGLTKDLDFQAIVDTMNRKVGFLPLEQFKEDKSRNKDYLVNTHWALYCDNYLEGFHIPFVHESLNAELNYSQY
jgi:choline monooxygenase